MYKDTICTEITHGREKVIELKEEKVCMLLKLSWI